MSRTAAAAFAAFLIVSAAAIAESADKPAPAKLPPLVERLGFAPGTRVVILNADDFGMNHATNVGTIAAMKAGGMTSATVMVPCPWFPEVAQWAAQNPKANLGLHLTLTSEWRRYKWGPVVGREGAPSLVDEQGYFYEAVPYVYMHAKLDEVEKEIRAQIDKALAAGIDVTHIDSHMGTLQYAPAYHEVYIKVAKDYNIPCRIAGRALMARYGGLYLVDMADEMGVLHPDELFQGEPPNHPDDHEASDAWWKKRLAECEPGKVSEIFIHAGMDTPEMHATTGTALRRTRDAEYFSRPETLEHIKSLGIELISYRELRELQRNGVPMPRVERYGWE